MKDIKTFAALTVLLASFPAIADDKPLPAYTIGPWHLGMTKDQVTSFADFGSYKPVDATGGIETFNAMIDGKKTNVSFVFDDKSLQYIQVWKYEGNNSADAEQATLDLLDMFNSSFGGADVDNINLDNGAAMTHGGLRIVLDRILGTAHDLGIKERKEQNVAMTILFDMHPRKQPAGSQLDAEFGYVSRYDTFYVFLFQDAPDAPVRRQQATIRTEKWDN